MDRRFDDFSIVKEIGNLAYTMWSKGWDESNGGNISYILTASDTKELQVDGQEGSEFDVPNMPKSMVGKYLLMTASGSQFRTLKDNLHRDVGIIKIIDKGYKIVKGFNDGKKPTSELYMHVLSHNARLKVDEKHRVVVHNHATNATAYSLVVPSTDKAYTLPLWKVLTESIVVFPDGVGVLPWQLPGTEKIGQATAEKLQKSRIVVWTFHGILATGSSFQDCFGLIETVDKAAKIYMDTMKIKRFDGLSNDQILSICNMLEIKPRMELFD